MNLPTWLPLDSAFDLLPSVTTSLLRRDRVSEGTKANGTGDSTGKNRLMWDYEISDQADLPSSLIISILSCYHGVRRAHLIDATVRSLAECPIGIVDSRLMEDCCWSCTRVMVLVQ